jgi:hypothetical protein
MCSCDASAIRESSWSAGFDKVVLNNAIPAYSASSAIP